MSLKENTVRKYPENDAAMCTEQCAVIAWENANRDKTLWREQRNIGQCQDHGI
jgi:hypothetical protein